MESPQPMDRLLCGDVGFGKTEVAMRAAFKALGDGKQVAVLAPTTVLCLPALRDLQAALRALPGAHRDAQPLPSPRRSVKSVLADLADGKVDIVIGTHRLLSKDVEFRDLGLLIVDEEQRFGVRHKERLKQIKKNVDVLTMTRHAHPAHAAHVAAGTARHVGDRDAAQGPAGHPHGGGAASTRS